MLFLSNSRSISLSNSRASIVEIFSRSIVVMLAILICSSPLLADDSETLPFERACSRYDRAKDFVRYASYYCLTHGSERDCEREAARAFEICDYQGSYSKIAARVHQETLLMIVLGRAPRLARGVGSS